MMPPEEFFSVQRMLSLDLTRPITPTEGAIIEISLVTFNVFAPIFRELGPFLRAFSPSSPPQGGKKVSP